MPSFYGEIFVSVLQILRWRTICDRHSATIYSSVPIFVAAVHILISSLGVRYSELHKGPPVYKPDSPIACPHFNLFQYHSGNTCGYWLILRYKVSGCEVLLSQILERNLSCHLCAVYLVTDARPRPWNSFFGFTNSVSSKIICKLKHNFQTGETIVWRSQVVGLTICVPWNK